MANHKCVYQLSDLNALNHKKEIPTNIPCDTVCAPGAVTTRVGIVLHVFILPISIFIISLNTYTHLTNYI